VLLPDGRTLLISQTGSLRTDEVAGSFALFDTGSETITRLPAVPRLADEPAVGRSPPATAAPGAAFSPHGIHLAPAAPTASGRCSRSITAGRESVEFFQLLDASEGYRLAWRGCALAPDPDSIPQRRGGTARTAASSPPTCIPAQQSRTIGTGEPRAARGCMLGFDTGHVLHWDGQRFTAVATGTAHALSPTASRPARDGKRAVRQRLSRPARCARSRYPDGRIARQGQAVQRPDNSQWDADRSPAGGLAHRRPRSKSWHLLSAITEGACGAGVRDRRRGSGQTLERGDRPRSTAARPWAQPRWPSRSTSYLYLGSFVR
jgi:hypothetical protein